MQCIICNTVMDDASVTDTYKCPCCAHVYIDYQDDGLSYHQNEYRTNKHGNRTTGEVVDGKFTDRFHNARNGIMESELNSNIYKLIVRKLAIFVLIILLNMVMIMYIMETSMILTLTNHMIW